MAFLKKIGRTERRHTKATAFTKSSGWVRLYNVLDWIGWKRIAYAFFQTPRPWKTRYDKHGNPLDVSHKHSKRMATVKPTQTNK